MSYELALHRDLAPATPPLAGVKTRTVAGQRERVQSYCSSWARAQVDSCGTETLRVFPVPAPPAPSLQPHTDHSLHCIIISAAELQLVPARFSQMLLVWY